METPLKKSQIRAANYANSTKRMEKLLLNDLSRINYLVCSVKNFNHRLRNVECSKSINLINNQRHTDIVITFESSSPLFLNSHKELLSVRTQIENRLRTYTTISFSFSRVSFQAKSVTIHIQTTPVSPLQRRKELDVLESDELSDCSFTPPNDARTDQFASEDRIDSGFDQKTEDDQTSTRSVDESKTIRSKDPTEDQPSLRRQKAPAPGAVKSRKFDGKSITDFHFVKSQESQTQTSQSEEDSKIKVKTNMIPPPDERTVHKSMQLARIRDYECMLRIRRYLSFYHECEKFGFKHETKITHEMYLRSQGLPASFVELKQLYVEALLPFYTSKTIADDLQMCRNMIKTERLIHMCHARNSEAIWRKPQPPPPLLSNRSSSPGTCDPECCILM